MLFKALGSFSPLGSVSHAWSEEELFWPFKAEAGNRVRPVVKNKQSQNI